ncbi:hypothetical protein ACFX19_014600 [Malus domestica]
MLIDYTQCGRIIKASELFQAMPIKSVVTCNAMIRGYGQNGEVAKVREVFDNMRDRDDRTWSAMIKVYELKGFDLEALDLFALMQREDIRPNFPLSVLSVCGSLANLDYGRQIHAQLVRNQFDLDVYVASVLMTMFVKCGDLVKAKQVFDRFSAKDIVMWNSMITSYAQHGLGGKALQVFDEMCSLSIAADEITFVGVLLACSYSGNVEKGLEIFETMKSNYQVEPGTAHFACMVDLLGRVGQVNEVMGLINRMPVEANAIVWGAVLGACRQHMKMDLAEVAAKKLTELEPYKARPYVLLSVNAQNRRGLGTMNKYMWSCGLGSHLRRARHRRHPTILGRQRAPAEDSSDHGPTARFFDGVNQESLTESSGANAVVSLYRMLTIVFAPTKKGRIAAVESVSYLAIQHRTAKRPHFAGELVSGEAQQGEDHMVRIRAAFGGCIKHSSSMGTPQPA